MFFRCFAYGSNMCLPKMMVAAPSAEFRMLARLPGYVLRFNKHSRRDGSGKGNIVASGNTGDDVWGVIFEINEADRASLDASEAGYNPIELEVLTEDGPLSAVTYIAKADRVDDSLKPYTWYKQFVVEGARRHGLPEAYRQKLEAVEGINDSDKEREGRNLVLRAGW